ncbi:HepT-like ribonuclease domain-containing protein [Actinokineospora enzanensis]|uniref:HepT-like ribonuclease domain-containing protein n=1 Tax=Actinokineospora enzanensis TaxID=155975 RepID=UPI00035F295C|nr:HepT-like ribonuclease domain-containing protein [Actinokineospora enzanensis]
MRRDPRAYLWDALRAAGLLAEFTASKSFADYQADAMLRSAAERQFEIIGEALNNLSKIDAELAARVPDLRRIVAFRNILIHGYATVDDALVWQVLTDKLPGLERVLRELLAEFDPSDQPT